MTLPRSAADVLARHVVLELECIDRIYCNLYVPRLQRDLGIVGFIREHLGKPVASTAVLAERTEAFYTEVRAFAGRNAIPLVDFRSGQRKDDVMREHLAQFLAEGRTEGVALDNGFAAVDDAAAVQAICDSFDENVIWDLAAKWTGLLPRVSTAWISAWDAS